MFMLISYYYFRYAYSADTNQLLEMDRMIAEGLRDIPSDEEVSDTEDDDLLVSLRYLVKIMMYHLYQ